MPRRRPTATAFTGSVLVADLPERRWMVDGMTGIDGT
jgi:hypothetical protein